MTLAEEFKHNHPSLSDKKDVTGMISLMLSNNGIQWSDEGSYAIQFDDGSCYHTYIITDYYVDTVK